MCVHLHVKPIRRCVGDLHIRRCQNSRLQHFQPVNVEMAGIFRIRRHESDVLATSAVVAERHSKMLMFVCHIYLDRVN